MPCTPLFMDEYMTRSYHLIKDYVRLWNHAHERAVRARLRPTETSAGRVLSGYTAFYRQCLLDGIVDLRSENDPLSAILDTDLAPCGDAEGGGDER